MALYDERLFRMKDGDFDAFGKILSLKSKVEKLFRTHYKLNISQIKSLLKADNISVTDEDLFAVMFQLFIDDGLIVKDDFWNKESEYHILNSRQENSVYSRNYYSYTVDNEENKDLTFLLISDTHIGNKEIEDFKLLDKVYDKAIALGIKKCFHLGDIFAGKQKEIPTQDELLYQLNSFINNYPSPTKEELQTIALIGNHDEWIHGFFDIIKNIQLEYLYDLRNLTDFIPSFYTIPRSSWTTDISDIAFHFEHRLYHSVMVRNLFLTKLDDFEKHRNWLDPRYDVLISGHLHKGMIYTTDIPRFNFKEQIFIGVPSTSQININETVAYKVNITYHNKIPDTMLITLINSDNNYNITEGETITWKFKEKNDSYQKILKKAN